MIRLHRVANRIAKLHSLSSFRSLSSNWNEKIGGEREKEGDEGGGWNDAWETAWLPEDLSAKSRAPWEADVNFGIGDAEAREFMAEMDEKWSERKGKSSSQRALVEKKLEESPAEKENENEIESLGRLEDMKKDYRLKKQRIHAGLWMKEIEKLEEAKFGGECDDIERLMHSCSDIFDYGSGGIEGEKARSPNSEFKAKPDGWETTSKNENDSNVWDMTQREEDILLQEFDRRIAYCKFQIASFIKTHIFSRRRPIDGWKYMIEELGPNARRGKGSVSRLPTLSDPSTQPYKEEKTPNASNSLEPFRRR